MAMKALPTIVRNSKFSNVYACFAKQAELGIYNSVVFFNPPYFHGMSNLVMWLCMCVFVRENPIQFTFVCLYVHCTVSIVCIEVLFIVTSKAKLLSQCSFLFMFNGCIKWHARLHVCIHLGMYRCTTILWFICRPLSFFIHDLYR